MAEYDLHRVTFREVCRDEETVFREVELDPEQEDDDQEVKLWDEFETQCEDYWGDDAYSFAEDGCDVLEIPPNAGALIDNFPSLESTKREHILAIVKRLIDQELSRR